MRADSALSHLYDGEACIATMQDGAQREVRWSREDWCFYYAGTGTVCPHDDIRDWKPATIRFDPSSREHGHAEKGVGHGQAS